MSITAQITMAWNGSELLVEAANPTTGAREKISTLSFRDLPLEFQLTLTENLRKAKARDEELTARAKQEQNDARESRARASEIARRNSELAHQKSHEAAEQRWTQYLSNLPLHVVAYHEHKRELRRAKSLETSRQIYLNMASTPGQGLEFANKIIEPTRRPKRIEVVKNGVRVTYYPQSDDDKSTKKAKKAARKNGVHIGHIDTSDFTF
jgi:hypothetical protein